MLESSGRRGKTVLGGVSPLLTFFMISLVLLLCYIICF